MKRLIVITTFLLMAIMVSTLYSGVPMTLSHQGRLLDASGEPKPDGEYEMKIVLYDSEKPDAEIVGEFIKTVELRNGIFNVEFGGSGDEFPDFKDEYWVGITIGNDSELKPRMKLSSVPYSIRSSSSEVADRVVDNGVPAGTVLIFAGKPDNLPQGWLICDGSALSSDEYPDLFSNLSISWGDGSNDASEETNFNLPDLRGLFLRGVDMGAGNDPDAGFRQAQNEGGNTGDEVGTIQTSLSPGMDSEFNDPLTMTPQMKVDESKLDKIYSVSGASESRPVNASVYYIIKVR